MKKLLYLLISFLLMNFTSCKVNTIFHIPTSHTYTLRRASLISSSDKKIPLQPILNKNIYFSNCVAITYIFVFSQTYKRFKYLRYLNKLQYKKYYKLSMSKLIYDLDGRLFISSKFLKFPPYISFRNIII